MPFASEKQKAYLAINKPDVNKKFKKVVTLSPLTPMATHYHIRNGAKLIGLNATTQNFEYNLKK